MVGRMDISRCGPCCGGGCPYVTSDGNEYEDDFASLDAGWLVEDVDVVPSIVSSRLHLEVVDSSTSGYTYRTVDVPTQENLLVVIECQTYNVPMGGFGGQAGFPRGIFFERWGSGSVNKFGFYMFGQNSGFLGTSGAYAVGSHGSDTSPFGPFTVNQVPVDGDKITIKILDDGAHGGDPGTRFIRTCFFLNEELVVDYEDVSPYFLDSSTIKFGLFTDVGIGSKAEFDNFSIHVGYP